MSSNKEVTLYSWTGSTLVLFHTNPTAAESPNKTSEPLIDPHITHSSISPPLLHIENITLYFTRGLRTEHLLSYKEQRTGKVCTANMSPADTRPVTNHLKPNTLAAGSKMVQSASFSSQHHQGCGSFLSYLLRFNV